MLTEYFAPLGVINSLQFLFALLVFELLGFILGYCLKFPQFLRQAYWIAGMGVFVTVWFVLHTFIPLWPQYVWISFIIIFFMTLYPYFRWKGYVSLAKSIITFPYALLFLLPIIKPLYFLLSAPPYKWDELAYHYYAPARLMMEMHWPFFFRSAESGLSFYDLMPRFIDTGYILMFALTKTYATARVLHFAIFISCIAAIGSKIKETLGLIPALLVLAISYYFVAEILLSATLGYVDVGVSSLAAITFVLVCEFLSTGKKGAAYAAAWFMGLSIGSKYTVLPFMTATAVGATIFLLIQHRKKIPHYKKHLSEVGKFVGAVTGLICLSGAYWYLKNFYAAGNPLYPFFFGCKGGLSCGQGKAWFAGWSIPFEVGHVMEILHILFQQNIFMITVTTVVLLATVLFWYMIHNTYARMFTALLVFAVIGEISILKPFAGFDFRYFYHWIFLISIVLVLPWSILQTFEKKVPYIVTVIIIIIYLGILAIAAGRPILDTIYAYNQPNGVEGRVRNFGARRMNLSSFLASYFPQTHEIIKWCAEPGPIKHLYTSDPSLIWSSYEGLLRVFLVSCTFDAASPVEGKSFEEAAEMFKKIHPDGFLVSLYNCEDEIKDEVTKKFPHMVAHYEYNNYLICNAQKVSKNIYKL